MRHSDVTSDELNVCRIPVIIRKVLPWNYQGLNNTQGLLNIIGQQQTIHTKTALYVELQLYVPPERHTKQLLTQTNHTIWCINTIRSPDDKRCDARNMYGHEINKYMKKCVKLVITKNLIRIESGTLRKLTSKLHFMEQQPLMGQELLFIEASRSHSGTPHSVGILWTSAHPVAETATWHHTQQTGIHAPGWNSDPQSLQASGRRPIP